MTSIGQAAAVRAGAVGEALRGAGGSDPGRQREVNEDRFLCLPESGVFAVIDGVGGQAAGGKAAVVARALLRERLAQSAGTIADRIREGITAANNEIYRLAATRGEWDGMACVLTIALVKGGKVTFGHVGDTRLYMLQGDRIEKLTRDHSPVGEREDASEISERQAMQHPRRNEVYRDVGSEFHDRRDRDFIDVDEVPFEPDAALLLCSDGLTDLVDSTSIARTVSQWAGDPASVVRELIGAANAAGGKDNVTVVYVEGDAFAASHFGQNTIESLSAAGPAKSDSTVASATSTAQRVVRLATLALLAGILAAVALWSFGWTFADVRELAARVSSGPVQRTVEAGGSITDALRNAPPGSLILVEPGEYREQIIIPPGVRLQSRVPRGATIRLPASDTASEAAVVARNVSGAEFGGFRVSGDSATPLPVGILVEDSTLSIVDVEITGATRAAIEFAGTGTSALMASDIRDNSGSALVIRRHSAHVSHNSFRHGRSERTPAVVVEQASPVFSGNHFIDMAPSAFGSLDSAAQTALTRDNWFVSR